jgi:hypothetical protein
MFFASEGWKGKTERRLMETIEKYKRDSAVRTLEPLRRCRLTLSNGVMNDQSMVFKDSSTEIMPRLNSGKSENFSVESFWKQKCRQTGSQVRSYCKKSGCIATREFGRTPLSFS